jgi:hypothetical protein
VVPLWPSFLLPKPLKIPQVRQTWWYTARILALRKLKQEDYEFKASLGLNGAIHSVSLVNSLSEALELAINNPD